MKNKKTTIILSVSILILIIASLFIFISLNQKPKIQDEDIEEQINISALESNFNKLFINEGNEYISTIYNINKEESGKYKIEAQIPYVKLPNQDYARINEEINDIFISKILNIHTQSNIYTTIKINYSTKISNNILSLMIKCELKEGSNPLRKIIKTYNYDLENNKLIKIEDIIPTQNREDIQNQINIKIENEKKKEETVLKQGYQVYTRDINSDIYLLKNASEFFIDNNIVYIIYSYGNNSYTSETDLIIIKI